MLSDPEFPKISFFALEITCILMNLNIYILNVYVPGSDKRDLRDIKVKIIVVRQKERTGFDKYFLKI